MIDIVFSPEQNTALKKCVVTSGTGLARTLMVMDHLTPSRMATKQMDQLIPPYRMATTQMGQSAHRSGTDTMCMDLLTHLGEMATTPMDHLTPGRMAMAVCTELSQFGLSPLYIWCMRTRHPRLMWINGLGGHTV